MFGLTKDYLRQTKDRVNYFVLINKLSELMGELELFPLLFEIASTVSSRFWVNQLEYALKSPSVSYKTSRCNISIIYRFGIDFNAHSVAQLHPYDELY